MEESSYCLDEHFASDEDLRLDRQLCFALYVASKELIKAYRPLLQPLGLTYTMYIALLALWEKDGVTVNELGQRMYLDSGTLTPLLKKLEAKGLVTRTRNRYDERQVHISLTDAGWEMKERARSIPHALKCSIPYTAQGAQQIIQMLSQGS